MTSPAEYEYAQAIIRRNTRNGYTAWQNVAQALGRHIEDVKREFDLSIPPMPDEPANENPTEKPEHAASRTKVLCYLAKGPAQPEIIAASTGMKANAVRARLTELQAEGLVCHDGAWGRATSRTWSLSAVGTQKALNVCPIVRAIAPASPRAPSKPSITA